LLGVLDVHKRESVEVVGLPTENDPGAVGAVATDTDVVNVDVPLKLVAVIVYTVVDVGFTVIDPMRVDVEKLPGVMATDEAFVIFHESVDAPAETTTAGDAENIEIPGKSLVCAAPAVSKVPRFASLLYSVAIQSGERATFDIRASSRVPFKASVSRILPLSLSSPRIAVSVAFA
jgi:hypothetical protein